MEVDRHFWKREIVWTWTVVGMLVGIVIGRLWQGMCLQPARIRRTLERQGITGPPPSFLRGNAPEMRRITQLYLHLSPTSSSTLSVVVGPSHDWPLGPLLGNGIIRANGPHWALQRKLLSPELYPDKVKGMVGLMMESATTMMETWVERLVESNEEVAEFVVDKELRSFSADFISKACFGSSYSQGKEIFARLEQLQDAIGKPGLIFRLPTLGFLPTKHNKRIRRLQMEIEILILKVINDRQELDEVDAGSKKDLLKGCWKRLVLWQECVHAEILEVSGCDQNCFQDLDTLNKLKTLMMVIQETLRLYTPPIVLAREALENIKLGDLLVPKGTHIWALFRVLHRDPKNWGPDANEFRPERFANGASEACKYPQAYMPFGCGARLCLGHSFAMAELKFILALILSKFSFSLSPAYHHSPVYRMLLSPQHGVKLLMKRF
ncbi:Cytochrome P450 [Dillenia turbinata]|uniref:Cytochrome P450 n=1 Tax=Dillenia turbinata TaxID=194707 RepID=A0AAN8VZQ5_9MAGN